MDNLEDNKPMPNGIPAPVQTEERKKFCKFCGSKIPFDAVVCTSCGRQVEELKHTESGVNTQPIIINNNNSNNINNSGHSGGGYQKNKWVALLLCIFLGWIGGHKFYEGKILMGILYIITCGFFGIGIFVDFILLLLKPNPYYV